MPAPRPCPHPHVAEGCATRHEPHPAATSQTLTDAPGSRLTPHTTPKSSHLHLTTISAQETVRRRRGAARRPRFGLSPREWPRSRDVCGAVGEDVGQDAGQTHRAGDPARNSDVTVAAPHEATRHFMLREPHEHWPGSCYAPPNRFESRWGRQQPDAPRS
jgi:hypothetical protein